MTNRAYAKNNGDGLLCRILWYSVEILHYTIIHLVQDTNQDLKPVSPKYLLC